MKKSPLVNWTKVTAAYPKRNCNREEFCRRYGVSLSTLEYHLRRAGVGFGKRGSRFVSVTPEVETPAEVTLELPAGIKLMIRR